MKTLSLTALLALSAFCLSSCKKAPAYERGFWGKKSGNAEPSEPDDGEIIIEPDTGGEAFALTCAENSKKGLRALRKLSNIEISNTIADVFGLKDGLDTSEFAEDIQKNAGGFDTAMTAANYVDNRRLGGYIRFAESVASKVNLSEHFPCLSQGASCFQTALPKLGALVWRRPMTSEEQANLNALGQQLISDGSKPEEAARQLVAALIVSRGFLYRSELGVANDKGDYELTDWEVASALSYLIQRRPPDPELRALAESGSLKKPATLKAQAERLLASANAQSAFSEFADMWLVASAVQGHETGDAEFTPAAKTAMVKETRDFFVKTLFDSEKGTFEYLLTADKTVAGSELAWLYEASPTNGQLTFQEEQRRGILGQGAFLASHASKDGPSPVTRGAYVLKKFLCTDFIGAPPSSPIAGDAANLSGRELRKKTTACSSCHDIIDPVGFSYEVFDQVGRYRAKDAMGQTIDTANTVMIDGSDVSYEGPAELSAAIARSTQGLECFSRQLYRYGMGRMERARMNNIGDKAPKFVSTRESNLDACYISTLTAAMQKSGGNLKAGVLAIVTHPGFILRSEVKNKAP